MGSIELPAVVSAIYAYLNDLTSHAGSNSNSDLFVALCRFILPIVTPGPICTFFGQFSVNFRLVFRQKSNGKFLHLVELDTEITHNFSTGQFISSEIGSQTLRTNDAMHRMRCFTSK